MANGNPSTPADFPLHSVGRENNPQHPHIYFVLPRFLIKENVLLDPEPCDFSPGGALYCTEHCYIHHTCLQGFALLGDIFSGGASQVHIVERVISKMSCEVLWRHSSSEGPHFTLFRPPRPHAVILLTHNGRSL